MRGNYVCETKMFDSTVYSFLSSLLFPQAHIAAIDVNNDQRISLVEFLAMEGFAFDGSELKGHPMNIVHAADTDADDNSSSSTGTSSSTSGGASSASSTTAGGSVSRYYRVPPLSPCLSGHKMQTNPPH